MTSCTWASIGTIWLGMVISPKVANTAVSESSTGTSAPVSDPTTTSRISSVSGMAIIPALATPPLISVLRAFSVDTPAEPT